MSANTDNKLDPSAEQAASAEANLAQTETGTGTKPNSTHDDSKGEGTTSSEKPTYTEMATHAASSATAAAAGVKDNVFSMFGGGAKKEKKEGPEDDADEPSGSSKAKKDAEGEVSHGLRRQHLVRTELIFSFLAGGSSRFARGTL